MAGADGDGLTTGWAPTDVAATVTGAIGWALGSGATAATDTGVSTIGAEPSRWTKTGASETGIEIIVVGSGCRSSLRYGRAFDRCCRLLSDRTMFWHCRVFLSSSISTATATTSTSTA